MGDRGVLLSVERRWECPSCGFQAASRKASRVLMGHQCPRQRGLQVPMVELGPDVALIHGRVRHRVVEWGDYVGPHVGVRRDADGRPVSAVRTERSDGSNDVVVFPATAVGHRER